MALDLAPVLDALLEDAEVVADAVADRGQLQRRQRVHEARGEPPEAAVAEARIAFPFEDLAQVEAALGGERLGDLVQAQVHQAQAQAAAGQELRRQVVGALDVALEVGALRREPAVHQTIAHCMSEGVVEVRRRRVSNVLGTGVDQMLQHRLLEVAALQAGSFSGTDGDLAIGAADGGAGAGLSGLARRRGALISVLVLGLWHEATLRPTL